MLQSFQHIVKAKICSSSFHIVPNSFHFSFPFFSDGYQVHIDSHHTPVVHHGGHHVPVYRKFLGILLFFLEFEWHLTFFLFFQQQQRWRTSLKDKKMIQLILYTKQLILFLIINKIWDLQKQFTIFLSWFSKNRHIYCRALNKLSHTKILHLPATLRHWSLTNNRTTNIPLHVPPRLVRQSDPTFFFDKFFLFSIFFFFASTCDRSRKRNWQGNCSAFAFTWSKSCSCK